MHSRRFDDFETPNEDSHETKDALKAANLTTKLERRRRIEELDEERRMREEAGEF